MADNSYGIPTSSSVNWPPRANATPNRPQPTKLDADTFKKFRVEAEARAKVIADQSRYITRNYSAKRKEVGQRINDILNTLWNEVPPPHLRLEFANMLGFTVTFAELWGFVGETMHREFKKGYQSFVSCKLIDKFEAYITTIEQCQRYGHVDMTNFSQMLTLRDEVVECLQDFYRITKPMMEKREIIYPKNIEDRYTPYDYEWLCGSVISGPYQLACVKYLCITRMAQMDINCMRADIIAEYRSVDTDFLESVRVPFPEVVQNPKQLSSALQFREYRLRENYTRTFEVLAKAIPGDRDLRFTNNTAEFLDVRGDIRRKKRNVMELLIHADRNDVRPFHQIIAVLSAMEAQLLVLLKVFSVYADEKLGFFGKPFPRTVFRFLNRLYLNTTLQSCRQFPLADEICNSLDDLRNECRTYIKEWFMHYEDKCEAQFTRSCDYFSEGTHIQLPYELGYEDFPLEVAHNVVSMLKYMRLEQIEMERLLRQLCQIKRAHTNWPKDANTPPLTLNITIDRAYSFCTNFPQVMSAEEMENVEKDALTIIAESETEPSVGEEIIEIAHITMEEAKAVPQCMEINGAFAAEFTRVLGQNKVDSNNAADLSARFADIVLSDIEMTNAREKYNGSKVNTAAVAQLLATRVVARYMEYVQTHHLRKFPVQEEKEMPSVKPRDSTETSTGSGSEDGSAFNENCSATDEQSEGDSNDYMESDDDEDDALLAVADDVHVAFMFNELSLEAINNAILLEAASKAILIDDPSIALLQYDEVPEEMIDAFVENFISVNLESLPDMSASFFNVPVD